MHLDVKKKTAEELYMNNFSQKQIAVWLDVTETTLSTWVKKYGWADKRLAQANIQQTIGTRINKLIDRQLEVMEYLMEEQIGEKKYVPLDKGQVDALSKLFSGIKQRELSFAQQVTLLTQFLDFLQAQNLDVAKAATPYVEKFIILKRQKND